MESGSAGKRASQVALVLKEPVCQCRRLNRHRLDPWVVKIPWRRAWQPTPVFLPGESYGQRSLAGHSPLGRTESVQLKRLEHTQCLLGGPLVPLKPFSRSLALCSLKPRQTLLLVTVVPQTYRRSQLAADPMRSFIAWTKKPLYSRLPCHRASRTEEPLGSQFSSVQLLSRVQLFGTPWTATHTPGLPVHHQLPEYTQTHVH